MTFASSFGRTFSPSFQPKSQAAASAAAFVPTDLANLFCWYDFGDSSKLFTDAGSTQVANDADKIYQANDKSGNNYHVIQATESKRPLYKTNVKNSKPAGLAAAANSQDLNKAGTGIGTGGSTVFCVCSPTTVNTNMMFTEPACRAGTSSAKTYLYGGAAVTSTNNVLSAGGWYLIAFGIQSDGNSVHYLNGNSVGSGDIGSLNSTNRIPVFSFGSAIFWNGYIGELIIYNNTVLSDTDRGKVETYLNNKWAIY